MGLLQSHVYQLNLMPCSLEIPHYCFVGTTLLHVLWSTKPNQVGTWPIRAFPIALCMFLASLIEFTRFPSFFLSTFQVLCSRHMLYYLKCF